MRAAIENRMAEVGLRLHPAKTRIVYCKDSNRRGSHEHTSFTFLGFTFRARKARNRHGINFASFLPAISKDALNQISRTVRSWRLHRQTGHSLAGLARAINPVVRGWMQYYGAFYRTALHPLLQRINAYLMRWLRKKYKRLRGFKESQDLLGRDHHPVPQPVRPLAVDPRFLGARGDKSRVTGDCHARICGSREVKFLLATRPVCTQKVLPEPGLTNVLATLSSPVRSAFPFRCAALSHRLVKARANWPKAWKAHPPRRAVAWRGR